MTLKCKSVCAGHEALIIAAAAVISDAESGARGCEGTVFEVCGVAISVDIFGSRS
jgi:hypothetical protein